MGNVGGTKKNWVMTFGRFNAQGGRHRDLDAMDVCSHMADDEILEYLRGWMAQAFDVNNPEATIVAGKVTLDGVGRYGVKWYGEAETFG